VLDGDGGTFAEVGKARLAPEDVGCQPVGSC
jgi:hypothetical protein